MWPHAPGKVMDEYKSMMCANIEVVIYFILFANYYKFPSVDQQEKKYR